MKKKFSVIVSMLIACSMLFAACGEDLGRERPKGTDLTIYMASELVSGSNDINVKKAIEDKFWKDTGISVNLKLQLKSKADFNTVMSTAMVGDSWDAAISYIGHSGIDDTLMRDGYAMDVSDLLDEYGENVKKVIDAEAFYSVTTVDDKVLGIPAINKTKKYGILVRKDLMTAAGFTEQEGNPDGLTSLVTIADFENMLRAMKANGLKTPLFGAPWDLEIVLTSGGANGVFYDSRKVIYNEDNSVKEVVPGYIMDEYKTVLSYAYRWQNDGLWEKDAQNRPITNRENSFIVGEGGVYVVNPETENLIRLARKVKAYNADAEFVMLEPLYGVDENGLSNGQRGFREDSRNYQTMVLNPRSQNTKLIVQYLDWMYSDVSNYELCAYGIEGEDWVKTGDGEYGYPEGKEDEYIRNPSYSKSYMLIKQEEFSYRSLNSYSEQEKAWLAQTQAAPTFKSDTNAMFFSHPSEQATRNKAYEENQMFTYCMFTAWTGSDNPTATFPKYQKQFRDNASEYVTHITNQYKLFLAERA